MPAQAHIYIYYVYTMCTSLNMQKTKQLTCLVSTMYMYSMCYKPCIISIKFFNEQISVLINSLHGELDHLHNLIPVKPVVKGEPL